MTPTARQADVVLPAQSWAEREGSFTSGERRVQRFYPAIQPIGESLPDWQILAGVGEKLGLGKPPFAAALMFREIAQAVPQYAGMSYRTLAQVVDQWPYVGGEDLYYGGTSYDNKSGVGEQWAAAAESEDGAVELFDVPDVARAGSAPDASGERLTAIPTTALYRSGTLINHSPVISSRIVPPSLLLHAADAAAHHLAQGDTVQVQVAGDRLDLLVDVDEDDAATVPGLALLRGVSLPPGASVLKIAGIEKLAPVVEEPALAAG